MEEYISKEKVKGFVRSGISTDTEADKEYVCSFIDSIPSADVRENIHGTWEEWNGNLLSELDCKCCSNCNHVYPYIAFSYNFCPNCGADMREVSE